MCNQQVKRCVHTVGLLAKCHDFVGTLFGDIPFRKGRSVEEYFHAD
ncbi:MAG: hypothetical protein Q8O31_01535 [Rhodocyclaceae bacterium]|nr:hypothetical protein [Rhodocyclaceae bacterium]